VTVYLIHFERPFGPDGAPPGSLAQHYIGSSPDYRLKTRIREELAGGARAAVLMQHVVAAGIACQVARTWPGGRKRERQLKTQGSARRLCPECGIRPGKGWTVRSRS
jgi:hypothetical protein